MLDHFQHPPGAEARSFIASLGLSLAQRASLEICASRQIFHNARKAATTNVPIAHPRDIQVHAASHVACLPYRAARAATSSYELQELAIREGFERQ
jgi:hypothetical protein